MDIKEGLRTLRATRRYRPGGIADEMIEAWVDTARWCGSSKNSQPWRFVAVRDRLTLQALSVLGDHAGHLADCEVALAVAGISTAYPFSRSFDLGRVAQSLMLAAHADGVGSCIAVFEPRSNVVAAGTLLFVPPDLDVEFAIGFGYPADRPADTERSTVSPSGRLEVRELLQRERLVTFGRDESGPDAIR